MFNQMVLGYILSKGTDIIKQITDKDVEKMYTNLLKEETALKGTNKIMMMAPEFQRDLVNEARKVVNNETDLYAWIKKQITARGIK